MIHLWLPSLWFFHSASFERLNTVSEIARTPCKRAYQQQNRNEWGISARKANVNTKDRKTYRNDDSNLNPSFQLNLDGDSGRKRITDELHQNQTIAAKFVLFLYASTRWKGQMPTILLSPQMDIILWKCILHALRLHKILIYLRAF